MASTTKSRMLRRNQTDAERLLWSRLRNKQLLGCKFRRQFPIEPYIADFVILELKLIVELDGSQHFGRVDYDQQRTAELESGGFKVIRFWNNDVLGNTEGVLEEIRQVILNLKI